MALAMRILRFCHRVRKFLSLDINATQFIAEPKIDGLSLSLRYKRQLVKLPLVAMAEGEDVTECHADCQPPNTFGAPPAILKYAASVRNGMIF